MSDGGDQAARASGRTPERKLYELREALTRALSYEKRQELANQAADVKAAMAHAESGGQYNPITADRLQRESDISYWMHRIDSDASTLYIERTLGS